MNNGELKEFASDAKYYVGLLDKNNELPSTP